jgi:hypothetical protein
MPVWHCTNAKISGVNLRVSGSNIKNYFARKCKFDPLIINKNKYITSKNSFASKIDGATHKKSCNAANPV